MNFKFKDIIFLIVLIYKLNIVCAEIQTLQTLPREIIQKILIFNDFDLDDYHSKIPIANTLNKNNFFQDSPCQIIAYLFNIAKPNLMLTCKQFDNYIKRNIKNEIPSQHKLYINFLIENQLIFNFNKERVLKNLAFLLFTIYNKKNSSCENNLEFYEPLAFALTFKKYNRSHLVENRYNIRQYQIFFDNVLWFNQNLSFYYLSEPEKLVLIYYLSKHLSIKFFDKHKPIFEKILKNEKQTKDFLDIIQYSIKQKYYNKFIEILFYNNNQYIEPNQNTIQIIKFFTLNNIHPHHSYQYQEYIDSKRNRYKNTLAIIELFSYYKFDCNDRLKNKESLIKFFLKKNFYRKKFFLGCIIKFLIRQESNCNHTVFEYQYIKNWLKKTFPKTDTDYEKFINIVSLLKNTPFIAVLSKSQCAYLLDKNSDVFKNMAKLRNFCQKHNHLLKAIAHFEQNPGIWRDNYYLKDGFEDDILSQIKCYCYNCNKNRLYTILLITRAIISILILSSVLVLFFMYLESLKNQKFDQKPAFYR